MSWRTSRAGVLSRNLGRATGLNDLMAGAGEYEGDIKRLYLGRFGKVSRHDY